MPAFSFARKWVYDMDIIKTLIEQIDKIGKYVSIPVLLLCVSICSFCIFHFEVSNDFLIVLMYTGSLFISIVVKKVIPFIERVFVSSLLKSSKVRKKIWSKLSDCERRVLVDMYEHDCVGYYSLNDRVMLMLRQRSAVYIYTQSCFGLSEIEYTMQPWAEKMVAENGVNGGSKS